MKLKVIHTPIYNINLLSILQRGKVTNHLTRTFMFTEESKYTTKNPEDQGDWNKLTGIASLPFNSQKSSHMWAWRYFNGNFEIAPYSHKHNGDRILPIPGNIFVIPIDTEFVVEMRIIPYGVFFTHYTHDSLAPARGWLETNYLLPKDSYRIITSWFGGTSLPKKTVKIYGI